MLRAFVYGMVMVAATLVAACSQKNVSYSRDIRPILDKNCAGCHAPGKSGFQARNSIGIDLWIYLYLGQRIPFGNCRCQLFG